MRQTFFVQMSERLGEPQSDFETLINGKQFRLGVLAVGPQRAGFVLHRMNVATAVDVVAQLHHIIIERMAVGASSDMQHVHQARVVA